MVGLGFSDRTSRCEEKSSASVKRNWGNRCARESHARHALSSQAGSLNVKEKCGCKSFGKSSGDPLAAVAGQRITFQRFRPGTSVVLHDSYRSVPSRICPWGNSFAAEPKQVVLRKRGKKRSNNQKVCVSALPGREVEEERPHAGRGEDKRRTCFMVFISLERMVKTTSYSGAHE